jgi:hypothetical protein
MKKLFFWHPPNNCVISSNLEGLVQVSFWPCLLRESEPIAADRVPGTGTLPDRPASRQRAHKIHLWLQINGDLVSQDTDFQRSVAVKEFYLKV